MGHGKTLEENFKSGGGDKRKLLKIFLLCMDHSKIILSNNSRIFLLYVGYSRNILELPFPPNFHTQIFLAVCGSQ